MVQVHSPSFVVGAKQDCWKCEASNEVITLATRTIAEATGPINFAEAGEIYLLSYIEEQRAAQPKTSQQTAPKVGDDAPGTQEPDSGQVS